MHKAASFMVLMVSAMVLLMVSTYAVQENNTSANEKILNNMTVNNASINITSTNFASIKNTAAIELAISENNISMNNTSINGAAFNDNNATAKGNNASNEQRNISMKDLRENESKSDYNIDKYSTINPMYNASAYSNIKGLFHVGDDLKSTSIRIGTTAKPGIDASKNASTEHTFRLGLPAKHTIETSKFPFMCNIV